MTSNNKDLFTKNLAALQEAVETFAANKETLNTEKGGLAPLGNAVAESLAAGIMDKSITEADLEALPKLDRTSQGYVSKAKKVGFARLAGVLEKSDRSVLRDYDILQETLKKQKASKDIMNQANHKTYMAIMASVDGDQAEADRIMANPASPEYVAALQVGFPILAEQEAKENAEKQKSDMGKFVTETKAALSTIRMTPFWPEIEAEIARLYTETRGPVADTLAVSKAA